LSETEQAATTEQEEVEDDLVEQTPTPNAAADSGDEGLPVVRNLFDWLQSAFVESPE
jgi:hypothetical protein